MCVCSLELALWPLIGSSRGCAEPIDGKIFVSDDGTRAVNGASLAASQQGLR